MACERCHSPRNVGRPAIGCMVARIAVIASVVYFAIVVGGSFWDVWCYYLLGARILSVLLDTTIEVSRVEATVCLLLL